LILAGDDDPIIPLTNARIMHRLVSRSELRKGLGHQITAIAGVGPARNSSRSPISVRAIGDDPDAFGDAHQGANRGSS
jgi:hypothetical protein